MTRRPPPPGAGAGDCPSPTAARRTVAPPPHVAATHKVRTLRFLLATLAVAPLSAAEEAALTRRPPTPDVQPLPMAGPLRRQGGWGAVGSLETLPSSLARQLQKRDHAHTLIVSGCVTVRAHGWVGRWVCYGAVLYLKCSRMFK